MIPCSLSSEKPVFCGVSVNSFVSVINCSLNLHGAEIGSDSLREMALLFWWKAERVKFYLVKPVCC